MEINWIKPEFWNAWKQSNTSSSKKDKSTNLGSIMEREEKRELYRIRCSSEENNVWDDMEGGIWLVCALDAPWLQVSVTTDEVKTHFRFFDGFDIWRIFWKFWSVEMKENEKWWILGFVGCDLVEKWRSYVILKFGKKGFVAEKKSQMAAFLTFWIYRGRRAVIDYIDLVIDYQNYKFSCNRLHVDCNQLQEVCSTVIDYT